MLVKCRMFLKCKLIKRDDSLVNRLINVYF
jgi:hypothetical protein